MTKRKLILTGKHVALAEMTVDDQPHFQAWLAGSPELRKLIDDHRVPTLEDQHKWFERSRHGDRKMFSIVTVPDHALIGNGGFVNIDPAAGSALFRITIGNAAFLGKGYGTEAAQLILRYGFETMGLREVRLEVLKTNPRAIRSYEKAGFVPADCGDPASPVLAMTIGRDAFARLGSA